LHFLFAGGRLEEFGNLSYSYTLDYKVEIGPLKREKINSRYQRCFEIWNFYMSKLLEGNYTVSLYLYLPVGGG
jgi:hypothetical protein